MLSTDLDSSQINPIRERIEARSEGKRHRRWLGIH
jgi:hypothetical protein